MKKLKMALSLRLVLLLKLGLGTTGAFAQSAAPVSSGAAETIEVRANKLSVETKIDRKVYVVADDAQSSFGTASDILNVIPSVDVDADGAVSLRGDGHVLILIDGKPSTQFQGSAAGENLRALSSADIERIEVLTTPPPQFKAQGAAGVINIVTRKHHNAGVSGRVQGSLGNLGRYTTGSSITYGADQGAVTLTAGFRHDLRERRVESFLIAPDSGSGQVLSSHSGFTERLGREVPSVGLSGDYALSESQSVNGSASWTKRGGLRTYTQQNQSSDANGVLVSSTGRLSSGHDPENDYDIAGTFAQKLARPGEALEFSLHRSISHQRETYDYTNQSFLPPAPDARSNLAFNEDHGIVEAGLDYVLPLGKVATVKFGYGLERDDYGFTNRGATVDPVTGDEMINPSLTNDFHDQQTIHSGYGSYQAVTGGFTWLGGLRTEWTQNEALLVTTNTRNEQRYFNVFPSLHMDYALTQHTTLSLGASRRITRPEPEALNPYIDHEYAPNLNSGNPYLKPQITQSFDLGFEVEQPIMTYQLTGYYRRNTNSVTNVVTYLGSGESLSTLANLPRNDSAGVEFSANGRVQRWLSYGLSGNAFYTQIDATQLGSPGLRSTNGVNLKAKLDFQLTAVDSLQVAIVRTDKRLTAQGSVRAINLLNLGYKRPLTPTLALVATLTDALNGQHFEREVSTPELTQTYQRRATGQVGFLGLVYTFGAKKKTKDAGFEYDLGSAK